jgi:MoxR-like ATPase
MFAGSISDLQQRLEEQRYIADRGLAVSLFLAMRLRRPLFLEGEAGVGKTALAGATTDSTSARPRMNGTTRGSFSNYVFSRRPTR